MKLFRGNPDHRVFIEVVEVVTGLVGKYVSVGNEKNAGLAVFCAVFVP